MTERRVQVQVFPSFQGTVSERWLRRVAGEALHAAAPGEEFRLSLVLADDTTVRELNRTYRGLDETTDVLAFAFDHPGEYEGEGEPPADQSLEPFISAPESARSLGEVIVSYPQCLRQAKAQGQPARDELALLVTHGVLHLLGYDHAAPDEERVMREQEASILTALGRGPSGSPALASEAGLPRTAPAVRR